MRPADSGDRHGLMGSRRHLARARLEPVTGRCPRCRAQNDPYLLLAELADGLALAFAAFVLAGVYGGALLALHRATRTSQMALGPFILVGTLAAMAL